MISPPSLTQEIAALEAALEPYEDVVNSTGAAAAPSLQLHHKRLLARYEEDRRGGGAEEKEELDLNTLWQQTKRMKQSFFQATAKQNFCQMAMPAVAGDEELSREAEMAKFRASKEELKEQENQARREASEKQKVVKSAGETIIGELKRLEEKESEFTASQKRVRALRKEFAEQSRERARKEAFSQDSSRLAEMDAPRLEEEIAKVEAQLLARRARVSEMNENLAREMRECDAAKAELARVRGELDAKKREEENRAEREVPRREQLRIMREYLGAKIHLHAKISGFRVVSIDSASTSNYEQANTEEGVTVTVSILEGKHQVRMDFNMSSPAASPRLTSIEITPKVTPDGEFEAKWKTKAVAENDPAAFLVAMKSVIFAPNILEKDLREIEKFSRKLEKSRRFVVDDRNKRRIVVLFRGGAIQASFTVPQDYPHSRVDLREVEDTCTFHSYDGATERVRKAMAELKRMKAGREPDVQDWIKAVYYELCGNSASSNTSEGSSIAKR